MSSDTYAIDEVEVFLTIADGKLTVESRSGAKSGAVELAIGESTAELTLQSAGTDRATATLTGPELSNFRTNVDAGLSSLMAGRDAAVHDRRVLASGFETLEPLQDGYGTTLDTGALQSLGIVDDAGALPGGSRQVKCTVLNSGTAIINLLSEDEAGFSF